MCLQHPRLMTPKEKIHSIGNHKILIGQQGITIMKKGKEKGLKTKKIKIYTQPCPLLLLLTNQEMF